MSTKTNPLRSVLKPMLGKYLTPEMLSSAFDSLMEHFPTNPGERNVILISKDRKTEELMAGVYGVDADNSVTTMHERRPAGELIEALFNQ